MMEVIAAYKKQMTQIFQEDGKVVPVTVLKLKQGGGDRLESIQEGVSVDIRGRSKGKGFMGVVKAYSFGGAPRTRGTKHTLRRGGSIGAGTDPARVWKGQKMPGRHAGKNVTVKNLEIVRVDDEKGELYIKGAVPGNRGTQLEIRKS